uniref:DNA polymerase n=1 Tax=Calocybe gangraenosa TaxID=2725000 RepID=A0A8F1ADY0_9AGAR|nr:DNA polymerase [Calocybe gangraenosa]
MQNKISNFKFLHFYLEDFTEDKFQNEIMKNFKLNTTYSILLKISSYNNLIFKMCGPQIGLIIKQEHDLDFYSKIYSLILTRIEQTSELYDYMETIESLEIMYSIIIPQKELILKNISNYSLSQQLVNKKEVKRNFNQNFLPLTTDVSYYGFHLLPESEERHKLITLINNSLLNKKENDLSIHDSDKLFIYNSPNNKNKFIIISKKLDDNIFLRYIFDYNTGIYINKIKDTIIPYNNNTTNNINNNKNLFDRTIGNITLTIENQKIKKYKVENKLQPIKSLNYKMSDRNINFGSFDLETFKDRDGLGKVYALGFYTSLEKISKLYYLTDYPDLDSYQLILKCIDDMLVNKYNNFIFYVHNLGRFDIVFLYNTLLNFNLEKGYDYYILDSTMRDSTIIRFNIKIKVFSNTKENKFKYIKISFVDSLNFFNLSLEKLTKELKKDLRKGIFPHAFVNKNTLNYIGNKPDFSFYDRVNIQDYNEIPINNWNLKSECLIYLNKDLKGLFEVMNEFSRLIFIYFNVQLTDALTITRLALNIFKSKFYKKQVIPSVNKIYLFNFIKEGYYGGITEVYRPYGKDLVYIDVNSLYPYVALNPLPGNDCYFMESFEEKGLDLDKLFGFFYAKVKTNNSYLGLLPVHLDNRLICPNGEFEGIWSSEELKFAKSKGYEITVIKGYQFNKVNDIFNLYIKELFSLKKNSTGFLKLVYKSLLNNFLGRFGLNLIKPITDTVNKEKRDFIFSTRTVHSHDILNKNKFLMTYDPFISKKICKEHGLDIMKVLEKEHKKNIENNIDLFKDVSIPIAAFVTSYAKIYINKIKLEIIENGGTIYYSDTDSIVLDKKFLNPNWISDEIGQFKLEYQIKEAFFISNKTYCLILINGETIIKTKGVINNSITVEDFKSMYLSNKNITATKYNSIINFPKAYVLIEKKKVTLNYNSYTKRNKIFNKEGLWIDTKPLNINNKFNS